MKRLISKKIILIFSLLLAFISVAGVLSGCGKSSNAAATKTVKVGVVDTIIQFGLR